MKKKDWKKQIFTIPNLLSLFRLLLIPVYVMIYLNAVSTTDYIIAAAILTVSCLTDLVDGYIARHYHMISTVGKILDPLADKATQFTLIICVGIRYPVLWWTIGLFVVKELFQLIAGAVCWFKGWILKGAQLSGKICTTVLFTTLTLLVLIPYIGETAVTVITIIDSLFLLYAFIDYILVYVKGASQFARLEDDENKI